MMYVLKVTTARKAVTLLLSYMIFKKALTEQHATGLILIAMGIIIKLIPDNKQPHPHNHKQRQQWQQKQKQNEQELQEPEEEERRPLV